MQCGKMSLAPQFLGSSQCASRTRTMKPVMAVTTAEAKQTTTEQAAASKQQKIYIGFGKEDTQPRSGRQGRFVTDDPRKYPQRTELVGGWAGGEVGLKQFVEEYKMNKTPASKAETGVKLKVAQPIGKGEDTIYVGFDKDDFEAKRTGVKGRVIRDDARKYPQRTELTGGFAGGEVGLKKFVESGDVPLAAPGAKRQQSPLLIAGVLGGAAVAGGLLLFDVAEVGEQALQVAPSASGLTAGIDDNTKALLQAAVLLAGITGVVAGGRAIVSAAANTLKEGAVKLGTLAVFWVAVFLVAQYVLSSP